MPSRPVPVLPARIELSAPPADPGQASDSLAGPADLPEPGRPSEPESLTELDTPSTVELDAHHEQAEPSGHAPSTEHEASHDAGDEPDPEGHHGLGPDETPHESPWVVTVPLILLAIPSVVAGFMFIEPMRLEVNATTILIMLWSVLAISILAGSKLWPGFIPIS